MEDGLLIHGTLECPESRVKVGEFSSECVYGLAHDKLECLQAAGPSLNSSDSLLVSRR